MTGTARRTSARRKSFNEKEWTRRCERDAGLLFASIQPPVSEARIVLDLREARIHVAEFLANALYEGPDIGPVSDLPVAGRKSLAMDDVVKFPVADIGAG